MRTSTTLFCLDSPAFISAGYGTRSLRSLGPADGLPHAHSGLVSAPKVTESARACSYFLSKVKGGTGNLSLLVANALAVNVLAVNSVS